MLSQQDATYASTFRRRAEVLGGDAIQEVRVFGSRARGQGHLESDLDLFVLIRDDDPDLRRQLMDLAWDVADELKLPYAPSPHVLSRRHFQRLLQLERLFARDIVEQGIAV